MNENISEQESLCYEGLTGRQNTNPLNTEEDGKNTARSSDYNHFFKRRNSDSFKLNKISMKNSPRQKSIQSFSQNQIVFDSEIGQVRKTPAVLGLKNKRDKCNSVMIQKQKYGQIYEDDLPIPMHHQSVMRKTFNKVKTQIQVKTFVDKMIKQLKRNYYLTFAYNKLFYSVLDDKASYFDIDNMQQQGVLSEDNTNKQQEKATFTNKSQKLSRQFLRKKYIINFIQRFANAQKFLEKIPIFSTFSTFKIIWDTLQLLSLGFFFIFIPIIVVFNLQISDIVQFHFFHKILLAVLSFDILINFNTSLFQQGREIKDHLKITEYYFKNGFLSDIVTLISLIVFISLENHKNSQHVQRLANILLLLFYFRFQQFRRVLKKIEIQYHFSPTLTQVLRLINLLLMNIYIIHVLSCFWILIAKWEMGSGKTWMHKLDVQDEIWFVQFLNSFYFNTVTMVTVGYGDVSPQTHIERLFSIITVLFACCVFAYSISEVGNIFLEMNKSSKKRKNNMFIINNYMKKKKITSDLQYQIRHYLEYYWNESFSENSLKEQKIINQLSNNLKENLMIEANRLLLLESPFFRDNFSFKTILKTVSIVTEQRCTPEEIIYLEGDIDDSSIFFIEKGSVSGYFDCGNQNIKPNSDSTFILKQGKYFGEVCFFTGCERYINFRSLEFTTLIKIERKKFLEILQECPQDFEKFCMIRDDILLNQTFSSTQQKCFYCKNTPNFDPYHFEYECPLFHYIPNQKRLQDSFKYHNIEEQRQEWKRSNQLKFNAKGRIEQVQGDQNRVYFTQEDMIYDYLQENGLNFDINDQSKQTLNSDESQPQSENQTSSEQSDNTSESSQHNHPANSSKSISPLKFFSRTPPNVDQYAQRILKQRGKSQIIEEDDFETDSPLKLRNPPGKLFQIIKQQSNKYEQEIEVNDFELSSLEEGREDKNISRKSSIVILNEMLPNKVNSMKLNSTFQQDLKSVTSEKFDENTQYIVTNQHLRNRSKLVRSRTKEERDLKVEHDLKEDHELQEDENKNINKFSKIQNSGQQQHPKNRKGSISYPDLKETNHVQIESNKKQKKIQSQQVKFYIPNKKIKRSSISLQELCEDKDLIKFIVKRYKSDKNLSQNSSSSSIKHTSSKRQISQNKIQGQLSHNNLKRHKSSIDTKIPLGIDKIINFSEDQMKSQTNFHEMNQQLDSAYNNIMHNQNGQRYSKQLDSLILNFQKIQDILTIQHSNNDNHQENHRFQRQIKEPQSSIFRDFDKMKSFEIYFPHNNYDNIINSFIQKQTTKNKKSQLKKGHSINLTQRTQTQLNASSLNNTVIQANEQNNVAISEIFTQNSLNRLKLLKNNNIRKNSISDQLILQQMNQKNQSDNQQNIPPSKKSIIAFSQEEETNKLKNITQNKPKVEQINQKSASVSIPNYFGVYAQNSESMTSIPNNKSKFAKFSFSKGAIEQDSSSYSQSEKDINQN